MKKKEEALFLYIVFQRRQKLNQNSGGGGGGRGDDKDFIVDLKPPPPPPLPDDKDSRHAKGLLSAHRCLSLSEQTTLNASPEEDLNEENDTLRNQSPFSQRF